jgi:hypothetical protein
VHRQTAWLLALVVLAPGCKREDADAPTRELAPYVQWCEAQGAARNSCLVSAARVTGDAAACGKLKGGGPERAACLLAAAGTSGRVDVCRPLADKDFVLCAFSVAAESGRPTTCDALEDVHWQGGSARPLCAAVARGDVEACTLPGTNAELGALCLRFVALRRKDASLCAGLGKDSADVQRCAAAVAVAKGAPEACAAVFSSAPGGPGQRRCEQEAAVAKGRFPPCFSDVALCERSLWVARPCDGTSGAWADDCLIHQAVFGTGPLGCGAVQDKKRRALCAQLRDAQEGYTLRAHPDAGAPSR